MNALLSYYHHDMYILQTLSIWMPEKMIYINAWLQSVLVYGSLFFCTLWEGQRSGSAAEQLEEIQWLAGGHFNKALV